jgi:hypothetical protein
MLVPVLAFAHEFADHLDDHFVVDMVIVGADDVGVAQPAFVEDQVYCRVVVVDVYPVANLLAGAVEFRLNAAQDVGNLAGNKLLYVLVWPVVVAAVADGGLDAKATNPGSDQMVGCGLAARVGA